MKDLVKLPSNYVGDILHKLRNKPEDSLDDMSIGDLFEVADFLGEIAVGGISGGVKLRGKLSNFGGDYIVVYSDHNVNTKEGLCQCIRKLYILEEVYKQMQG